MSVHSRPGRGWHPASHLGEKHADDRGTQPGGGAGPALVRTGHEPPGRHGEELWQQMNRRRHRHDQR